jgi:hypothetical protein
VAEFEMNVAWNSKPKGNIPDKKKIEPDI